MKQFGILLSTLSLLLALPASAAAEAEAGSVAFADARVVYDYAVTDKGLVTLTLVALVDETNNSLRGLKNSDPRRLSKLGQLIYQCKLMLYRSDQPAGKDQAPDPFLISRNFSLFTGVDLPLGSGERIGVQALALREVDANSLFSASLGQSDSAQRVFESVADGEAVNL